MVWDSERPAADQVYSVLKSIGTTLKLADVFHQISDQRWAQNVEHELVGVVSYYGKHYTTFFFHTKLRVWVYFDDANVKEVGPSWEGVVDKCTRGRYQPLLLLYATPQPQQQTPGQSHSALIMDAVLKSHQQMGRRAVTPSPEKASMGGGGGGHQTTRRAITPTPIRGIGGGGGGGSDYQNLSVIQSKIFQHHKQNNNNEESSSISSSSSPSPPSTNGSYSGGSSSQYQNLSVIQDSIFSNGHNQNGGDNAAYVTSRWENNGGSVQMSRKPGGGMIHQQQRPPPQSHGVDVNDGLSIPDHLNQPRRRDSGNWSGDRNSASSSSSTTLENPYLYMVGKQRTVPNSPTRSAGSNSSSSNINHNNHNLLLHSNGGHLLHHFDPGYDSYSLSSTDSYPPKTPQNQHALLAKIPESVTTLSSDCERLCIEADQLLEKSRLTEDAQDFETALVLCNSAAGKARAAMDAPYSNPHTMTFARMKHNTCVMRARSLHRRILMEKGMDVLNNKDQHGYPSVMSGPGAGVVSSQLAMNGTTNAARQMKPMGGKMAANSSLFAGYQAAAAKDGGFSGKGGNNNKTIEIYATLPKQKKTQHHQLKLVEADDIITTLDPPTMKPERESRSIFSRGKRNANDEKDKRSRSEDRNKSREFSLANNEPLLANAKDTLKKHKEDREEKKEKDKSNKKQHKVRRKLLMGGLIRRKNRSMPDLTEGKQRDDERCVVGNN